MHIIKVCLVSWYCSRYLHICIYIHKLNNPSFKKRYLVYCGFLRDHTCHSHCKRKCIRSSELDMGLEALLTLHSHQQIHTNRLLQLIQEWGTNMRPCATCTGVHAQAFTEDSGQVPVHAFIWNITPGYKACFWQLRERDLVNGNMLGAVYIHRQKLFGEVLWLLADLQITRVNNVMSFDLNEFVVLFLSTFFDSLTVILARYLAKPLRLRQLSLVCL